jgi:tetratricopeptide (TPR) repeat protein
VLLIVEDLHWLAPTTLEWLDLLIAQGPTALLFILLTCRPTFASPWSGRTHVTHLTVSRLTVPQVQHMAQGTGCQPHSCGTSWPKRTASPCLSKKSPSLSCALYFAGVFHQFRHEASAAQALAEATVKLATEQGMAQRMATEMFLRGWALTMQGRGEEGLAHMRQGLADYRATGTVLDLPWYLGVLAEACGRTDRADEGLSIIAEALAMADDTGYYAAELYRLKGVLLMQHAVSDVVQAEACLQQALTIARCQQAKSLELRAAVNLVRLWQRQGKHAEAQALLEPIYGWFTEGLDTADLQEARVLLETLG